MFRKTFVWIPEVPVAEAAVLQQSPFLVLLVQQTCNACIFQYIVSGTNRENTFKTDFGLV